MFTNSQKRAIDIRNSNLLVAAAAGSGKTAVLVERIIQIVTNKDKPVNIDRLLVVTFTEAAAGEMKERISKAIEQKLNEDGENRHLKSQAVSLGKSSISTIHAFCRKIIKENFHIAGVDPMFNVGDSIETDLLQEKAMGELFENEYSVDHNKLFYNLIEMYSDRFYDDKLKEMILDIYRFAQSNIDPNAWLRNSAEYFNLNEDTQAGNTIWGKIITDAASSKLRGSLSAAKQALGFCDLPYGPLKYKQALNEDIALIEYFIAACEKGFGALFAAMEEINYAKLSSIRKTDEIDEELKEMVKNIREKEIKKVINDIKSKYFFKEENELLEDIKKLYPYIHKLSQMVISFGEIYMKLKLENNVLDFNDLEHLSLKVLTESEQAAQNYRNEFDEIYIDEYQDSNAIQENILELVSRGNNRFMVGDVKQSIYKFRRADPSIFLAKYHISSDSGENIKIDLNTNFRSRKNVLDSINLIFEQLMSEETCAMEYGDAEKLYYGANYPESDLICDKTELLIADNSAENNENDGEDSEEIEDLKTFELEAELIAKRISEMVDSDNPQYVYDKNTKSYRKAGYGDIVILLRSIGNAQTIVQALTGYGIPAYANTTGGFFDNIEILVMLSLIKVIDNPRQDVHILGVLHSPIYGIDVNGLVEIRQGSKAVQFYDALIDFTKNEENLNKESYKKAIKFLADFEKWRRLKSQITISRLISEIFNETGYMDYISSTIGAEIRRANLMTLFECALQFEKGKGKTLFKFVKYIERLMLKENSVKESQIVTESGNAVQIMTIHKSKGLEFPVCFLSGVGKSFNKMDEYSVMNLHQKHGYGPMYVDLNMRMKSNTLARCALRESIHDENYAEELRVLYVALTRAKDKLIITGGVKNYQKLRFNWLRFFSHADVNIPPSYVFGNGSFLDWIGVSLIRHRDFPGNESVSANEYVYSHESSWKVKIYGKRELTSRKEILNNHTEYTTEDLDSQKIQDFYGEIEERFSWEYPNAVETVIPSKTSISEMKRNYFSQMKAGGEDDGAYNIKPIFKKPSFASERQALTSAEKGTALHTLMEHLDINSIKTSGDVENLIGDLKIKNLLSEKEADSINKAKVLEFLNSGIAKRMKESDFLRKEAPFVMEMEAGETYLPDVTGGKIMVHGIIDCYFIENDEIILVDFKSDYLGETSLENLIERYKIQMKVYKKALENSYDKKVSGCYLYLFDIGKEIEIII